MPYYDKNMKTKKYREIAGVALILAAILVLLSLASYDAGDFSRLTENRKVDNIVGPIGAFISHGFRIAFGSLSYLIIVILTIPAAGFIKNIRLSDNLERISAAVFLMIAFSTFAAMIYTASPVFSGGYVGLFLYSFFRGIFGEIGSALVVTIFCLTGLILAGIVSISGLIEKGSHKNFGTALKSFISGIKSLFMKKDIPLNNIPDGLNRKKKRPWIEKKTLLIYKDGTRRFKEDIQQSRPVISLPYTWSYDPDNDEVSLQDLHTEQNFENESWEPLIIERSASEDINIDTNSEVNENESNPAQPPLINFENDEVTSIDKHDTSHTFEEEKPEFTLKQNRITDISEEREEKETHNVQQNSSRKEDNTEEPAEEPAIRKPADHINQHQSDNPLYSVPVNLLYCSTPIDSDSWNIEVKKNSSLLVNTLSEFGIESKVVAVNRGPVITLYEMQIAPGIKLNKVTGLADDIAMALAAYKVRIVAPIPGKSAIGIEIPNSDRENVTLGDIIESKEYRQHNSTLKVILGKDILGKPQMIDLKKMPHLLIAGATGSGKSVCVNALITSLIYNYGPAYLRFIMVDPKMVELQLYNGLPHMLTPVITEPSVAPSALKWTTYEMERRYRLLSEMNTRDIERYNQKVEMMQDGTEPLPYIVTIIDELADLMMVSSKEIEGYITRIAQKARAVGIHLVLATQRPSVDVITGIIKANFPARIAFQVAQKTDSRTIIDQNGAEKLLGKGDMLYQSPFSSFPVRIQGAFISEDEIIDIVSHLRKFGTPQFIDIEESLFEADREMEDENSDELFVEALKIVEDTKKASASYLQRRLSIGYNRAARIIELMEDRGYIGPQQGSKPRDVYI